MVGVSGGPDSLCMLHMLHSFNVRERKGWQLRAVHVNPGFEGWDSERVLRACRRIGVECSARRLSIPARHDAGSCYICARERRRALFKAADELGCRRLALAHHLEDVNETFLMNLLFTSSGATMIPCQPLFKGRMHIVRPLYYLDKKRIRHYLRHHRLHAVRNHCPRDRGSSRATVRRFLARLATDHPRIQNNLFSGIQNLKPEYLPRPPATGEAEVRPYSATVKRKRRPKAAS